MLSANHGATVGVAIHIALTLPLRVCVLPALPTQFLSWPFQLNGTQRQREKMLFWTFALSAFWRFASERGAPTLVFFFAHGAPSPHPSVYKSCSLIVWAFLLSLLFLPLLWWISIYSCISTRTIVCVMEGGFEDISPLHFWSFCSSTHPTLTAIFF